MINKFPNYSLLDITHQDEIQKFCAEFDPYSDFNFTSLFAWNTMNDTSVSVLNNNLIITMPDYISGKPIYSILGTTSIDESLEVLLNKYNRLSLVPEVVIDSVSDKNKFIISEDRDQFDYVYEISEHAMLQGGRYRGKRKRINQFLRANLDDLSLRKIRFTQKSDIDIIKKLFNEWISERHRTPEEAESEGAALENLVRNSSHFDLMGIFIYIDNLCVGYSINEIVSRDYAICHFQKAKLRYEYIDIFLSSLVAKELHHFGCKYINWEQDLGISGLRELKESYLPEFFLKKYNVKLRS